MGLLAFMRGYSESLDGAMRDSDNRAIVVNPKTMETDRIDAITSLNPRRGINRKFLIKLARGELNNELMTENTAIAVRNALNYGVNFGAFGGFSMPKGRKNVGSNGNGTGKNASRR
jgi:hypothetical protein